MVTRSLSRQERALGLFELGVYCGSDRGCLLRLSVRMGGDIHISFNPRSSQNAQCARR